METIPKSATKLLVSTLVFPCFVPWFFPWFSHDKEKQIVATLVFHGFPMIIMFFFWKTTDWFIQMIIFYWEKTWEFSKLLVVWCGAGKKHSLGVPKLQMNPQVAPCWMFIPYFRWHNSGDPQSLAGRKRSRSLSPRRRMAGGPCPREIREKKTHYDACLLKTSRICWAM